MLTDDTFGDTLLFTNQYKCRGNVAEFKKGLDISEYLGINLFCLQAIMNLHKTMIFL